MNPPKVSVIVPSYNKPEYLPECLRSVQAQTFTDWECIVVNDGSPRADEIRAAVAAMNDPRFRLVGHATNQGPAAARNTGVREARSDCFLWLDEDDLLVETCLERTLAVMESTGAEIVRPHIQTTEGTVLKRLVAPDARRVLVNPGLHSVGFLFRKSVYQKAGELDEAKDLYWGLEDIEWWIRVIYSGVRIHIMDDVLYVYRPAQGAELQARSQHLRGMRNARTITRYIVAKHREKYRLFPRERRQFLERGCHLELMSALAEGHPKQALVISLEQLWIHPTLRNLRLSFGLLVRTLRNRLKC